jgi:hypothetical protein
LFFEKNTAHPIHLTDFSLAPKQLLGLEVGAKLHGFIGDVKSPRFREEKGCGCPEPLLEE